MLRIIYKFLGLVIVGFVLSAGSASSVHAADTRLPLKSLFNHKKHNEYLKDTNITCTDCHDFGVKSSSFDPTAKNVGAGFIVPDKKVCHQCHLGKVEVARVNQCTLCHINPEKLAPDSHRLAWKKRHGQFAQMNPASCNDCHKDNQNSCTNCHTQKISMKSIVHRPNFRLTHSIEARANPASCVTCHASTKFCLDCHTRGIGK